MSIKITLLIFLLIISTSATEEVSPRMKYVALPDLAYFTVAAEASTPTLSQDQLRRLYVEEASGEKTHYGFNIYELTFHNYPTYLKDLFTLKLKGFKPIQNVHLPDWIIWTLPQIRMDEHTVSLELLSNGLAHMTTVGHINLQETNMAREEAAEFCKQFITRHSAAERPLVAYGPNIFPEGMAHQHHWTEVDQVILLNLTRDLPATLPRTDGIQNDEIARRIGDFFTWRQYVLEFRKMVRCLSESCPEDVGILFTRYLKRVPHVEKSKAKAAGPLMNQRLFYLSLAMSKSKPDNVAFIDCVFGNMQGVGLFLSDEEQLMYRKALFPRDEDD
jgi:hypothetical protein